MSMPPIGRLIPAWTFLRVRLASIPMARPMPGRRPGCSPRRSFKLLTGQSSTRRFGLGCAGAITSTAFRVRSNRDEWSRAWIRGSIPSYSLASTPMSSPDWAKRPTRYRIPGAAWTLHLSPEAIALLSQHAQRHWWTHESVGQLYSRDLTAEAVVVHAATLLKPSWAAFTGVGISRDRAIKERESMFQQGLHAIGIWHSHPEAYPKPSRTDLELAADYANAAKSQVAGVVFIIVGKAQSHGGLLVGVHDGSHFHVAAVEPTPISFVQSQTMVPGSTDC